MNVCIEEIGGFDENFFLYKEENLCLRIRRKNRNAKIIYYPEPWWQKEKTILRNQLIIS